MWIERLADWVQGKEHNLIWLPTMHVGTKRGVGIIEAGITGNTWLSREAHIITRREIVLIAQIGLVTIVRLYDRNAPGAEHVVSVDEPVLVEVYSHPGIV